MAAMGSALSGWLTRASGICEALVARCRLGAVNLGFFDSDCSSSSFPDQHGTHIKPVRWRLGSF